MQKPAERLCIHECTYVSNNIYVHVGESRVQKVVGMSQRLSLALGEGAQQDYACAIRFSERV